MNPINLDVQYDDVIKSVIGEVTFDNISNITDIGLTLSYINNNNNNILLSKTIPVDLIEDDNFNFTFPSPKYRENLYVIVNVTHDSGTDIIEEAVIDADIDNNLLMSKIETSDAYSFEDEDDFEDDVIDTYDVQIAPFITLDMTINTPLVNGQDLSYTGGGNSLLINNNGELIETLVNAIPFDSPFYIEEETTNILNNQFSSLINEMPPDWVIGTGIFCYGEIKEETTFANSFELSVYNNTGITQILLPEIAIITTEPVSFSTLFSYSILGDENIIVTGVIALDFIDSSNNLLSTKEVNLTDISSEWDYISISASVTEYPLNIDKVRPRLNFNFNNDAIFKFFLPTLTQLDYPTTLINGLNTRLTNKWVIPVPDSFTSNKLKLKCLYNNRIVYYQYLLCQTYKTG